MAEYKDKFFSIIRHRGTPREGTLPSGMKVYARDKFFFIEVNRFVPCAPYNDNFLYEVPSTVYGARWRCSCGSVAVCSGYSGYKDSASQQGLLFVCLNHANTGVHLNGSVWI